MPRYIDADAELKRLPDDLPYKGSVKRVLIQAPAADVVEVVRCRDCVHWGGVAYGFICRKFSGIDSKICMGEDNFCSYGERREKQ